MGIRARKGAILTPKESYVLWLLSGKTLCVHCNVNPITQGCYMHCSAYDWSLHVLGAQECIYYAEIERNRL